MSVVVLNMKFIMTDIQFAPLNSILLFMLNILLANILPAEYSDEYPAGWYLVCNKYKIFKIKEVRKNNSGPFIQRHKFFVAKR